MQIETFPAHVRRTNQPRRCPECLSAIPTGKPYVRFSGIYDGDFYRGIHCRACDMLGKRYFEAALRDESEVTYNRGDLIYQVADFLGYESRDLRDLTLPQKRTLLFIRLHVLALRYRKHWTAPVCTAVPCFPLEDML